jgi:hypothetical protein
MTSIYALNGSDRFAIFNSEGGIPVSGAKRYKNAT